MKDCIFCNIIAGEIPSYVVYEDNHAIAFLDIRPCTKGHTVVVPKVHAETLLDLDEELVTGYATAVQRAMKRVDHVLHPDGYTVGWNHGVAGGQAVPHLHTHILPRWEGDRGANMHAVVNSPSDVSVEELAKRFA